LSGQCKLTDYIQEVRVLSFPVRYRVALLVLFFIFASHVFDKCIVLISIHAYKWWSLVYITFDARDNVQDVTICKSIHDDFVWDYDVENVYTISSLELLEHMLHTPSLCRPYVDCV
jgi:hypothetical protein